MGTVAAAHSNRPAKRSDSPYHRNRYERRGPQNGDRGGSRPPRSPWLPVATREARRPKRLRSNGQAPSHPTSTRPNMTVNTTWEQESSDRHVGDYLESVWRDPASPTYKVIIDSRPAEGAPPPMAAAEAVQAAGEVAAGIP